MGNGWIKLHRKILDNPISKKPVWSWLWIVLLLKANHDPKKFIWNGRSILVNSGQFITGRKELSKETGINESSIQRILKYLEIEHQIEQQKTTKYRLITIVKWEDYQNLNIKSNNKRTTSEHKQEVKEVKEEYNTANRGGSPLKDKKNEDDMNVWNEELGEWQKPPEKTINPLDTMKEVIAWAENRRGGKFMNIKKQYKALALLRKAAISPNRTKDRYCELERDEFWKKKGFDFMDVCNSFDKRP
jgi:DNA-binding transcriptional regulator YhcF (GntR family)